MRITLHGPVCMKDGYGNALVHIARELIALGHFVSIRPTHHDATGVPEEVNRAIGPRLPRSVQVALSVPGLPIPNERSSPLVAYTMYEFPRLPPGWGEYLNKADLLISPCRWVREVFRENGIARPVEIVPLGYDSGAYALVVSKDGPPLRPWTFLCLGTLQVRKAPVMLAEAFQEAFPRSPHVRLRLKTVAHMPLRLNEPDPRIEVIDRDMNVSELADLYRSADCFVYPTRGEGFGLPPLEAAACGLAVMQPRHTALMDQIYPSIDLPIYGWETQVNLLGNEGLVPALSYRGIREALLHSFHNQKEYRALGLRAAEEVKAKYTWKHTAEKLTAVLEKRYPSFR